MPQFFIFIHNGLTVLIDGCFGFSDARLAIWVARESNFQQQIVPTTSISSTFNYVSLFLFYYELTVCLSFMYFKLGFEPKISGRLIKWFLRYLFRPYRVLSGPKTRTLVLGVVFKRQHLPLIFDPLWYFCFAINLSAFLSFREPPGEQRIECFPTSFSNLTLTVHKSWLKLPVGISHILGYYDKSMCGLLMQEV